MLRALLVATVLVTPLATAHASAGGDAAAEDAESGTESSLLRFVDDVARGLEQRAALEKVHGAVRLEVTPSRGIDAAKVDKGFLLRLKKRLKDGGALVPSTEGGLRCRITISEEGGLVWATALLEGAPLLGPSAVAVSRPVDRELEASLGAVVKPAQTRFVLERLGAVPAGTLDAALVDVDGDGLDELALLGVDGLRLFRTGGSRLERTGAVVKLGGDRRWPRVATGWLARLDGARLWAVTSAGHSLIYDAKTQRTEAGPADLVPLRGAPGPQGPLCGSWRAGSPSITLPLVTLQGAVVRASLPSRVRDVVAVPGKTAAWIIVDDQGQLLSQRGTEPPTALAAERVGDRLALADLDGDGDPELVTTSASAPGEPDHLVLRRVDDDLSTSTVVFRSPLSGGSIVATAVGRVDFGARLDVVLVEEVGKEALAWRLRYSP